MANNKSRYFQNQTVNWMKGTTFVAAPTTTYLALLTTMPTDSNGTSLVEVTTSGTAYARQALTSASAWSAVSTSGTAQQISNAALIAYTQATATYGTVLGAGIYDAVTAGNLIWYGTITTSQAVASGNTFQIAIGGLVLLDD